MIEPQNTMLPLAAESAPAELPQGEEGFGAVLANTLGMIAAPVDPNAITGLLGEHQRQADPDAAGGGAEPFVPEQDESVAPAVVARRAPARPLAPAPVVANPIRISRPPVGDDDVVGPVFVKPGAPGLPPAEVAVGSPPPVEGTSDPLVPAPVGDDGIYPPSTDGIATASAPTPAAPVPAPAAPAPAAGPVPHNQLSADSPAGPIATPSAPPEADNEPPPQASARPPVPVAAPVDKPSPTPGVRLPIEPEPIDHKSPVRPVVKPPVEPVIDQSLPMPTPLETTTAATSGAVAPASAPRPGTTSVAPDPIARIAPDTPVRIEDAAVPISRVVVEPQAGTERVVTPAITTSPAPLTEATHATFTPAANPSSPAPQTQHSALAERVMQAVELQANQPPPRTMVVEIPEIEGLRLVVSVRAGAEVHVVPASTSSSVDGLNPFFDELQGVLADRGFVMTGDGRRRRNQPREENEAEPRPNPQPRNRRPDDGDLRI